MGSVRAHYTYQNDYMSNKLWNIMEINIYEQTPWNREGALDVALDWQTIYRLHVQNTLGYVVFLEQKQRSSVLTPLLWICCSVSAGADFQMNRVYSGSLCSEEQSNTAKKTLIGGRGRQACVLFVGQHFVWHTGKVSSISPVFLWPFGQIVMASHHAWNAVGWICR